MDINVRNICNDTCSNTFSKSTNIYTATERYVAYHEITPLLLRAIRLYVRVHIYIHHCYRYNHLVSDGKVVFTLTA